MLVLIGKGASEASSRFLPMGVAEVRVRALVVSIKKACRCSNERLVVSINAEWLFAIWIDGVAEVRVRALVVSINGVC